MWMQQAWNLLVRRIVLASDDLLVLVVPLDFLSLAVDLHDLHALVHHEGSIVILQAIIVISSLFFLARFISRTSSAQIKSNKDISPSMQVLAVKFLQVLLYGAAFFIGLRAVGVDLTGLAVLSGAIGVGLGQPP